MDPARDGFGALEVCGLEPLRKAETSRRRLRLPHKLRRLAYLASGATFSAELSLLYGQLRGASNWVLGPDEPDGAGKVPVLTGTPSRPHHQR
jgi:hypothetical protein